MKNKLQESLRALIQKEIKSVLTESTLSGDYDKVKNKLPKKLRQFCDEINTSPKFTEDLQYITYDSIGKKLKFSLDSYSEAGMNMLLKLVKQTVKLPEYKSLLKFNAEDFSGEDIELDIKNVQGLNENTNDFKVGEIYRDGDVEYQITTMPDKFKGKYGAGTMNIWVTNLDTEEQHFMPVSMLKTLKQVYVTPPEGRLKHLKTSTSREMHEGPEEMTYTYVHDPKTNKFNVLKVKDGAKVTAFSTEDQAKKHVEKINKLDKGYAAIKGKVAEGPEEMGAYRRLVITSPAFEKMKTEFTKFMGRPEVKSMYPVRFKMIDSPKPNTVVVDVEGDKATVVAIKLSDLAKKLDKSVAITVRKERKLK